MEISMERTEVARQFEEIFETHHDPKQDEKRRYMKNRKEREDIIKQDTAID